MAAALSTFHVLIAAPAVASKAASTVTPGTTHPGDVDQIADGAVTTMSVAGVIVGTVHDATAAESATRASVPTIGVGTVHVATAAAGVTADVLRTSRLVANPLRNATGLSSGSARIAVATRRYSQMCATNPRLLPLTCSADVPLARNVCELPQSVAVMDVPTLASVGE